MYSGRSDLGSHIRPNFYRHGTPSSGLGLSGSNYGAQYNQSERDGLLSSTSNTMLRSETSQGDHNEFQVEQRIWGTTIEIGTTQREFDRFLRTYLDPSTGQPLYLRVIREISMANIYY